MSFVSDIETMCTAKEKMFFLSDLMVFQLQSLRVSQASLLFFQNQSVSYTGFSWTIKDSYCACADTIANKDTIRNM